MKRIFALATSTIAVSLLGTSPAFALKAGDNVLGLGVASINPDAKAGVFSSTPVNLPTLVGTSADVSSELTVSLGLLHMYTDNIGVEGTIGMPPKHSIDLSTPNGILKTHPNAATLKQYSPTIVGKYFFNIKEDKLRPYLGLGVTHVSFHDVEINRNDPEIRALAGTSIKLSSKFVPVYNAGFVYEINDRWSINASVSYLPIKTTLTAKGAESAAGLTTTGDLKLNTIDYVFRIGYKF